MKYTTYDVSGEDIENWLIFLMEQVYGKNYVDKWPPKLVKWYNIYLESKEERLNEEIERTRRENVRLAALRKLSSEEIKLLGIDF